MNYIICSYGKHCKAKAIQGHFHEQNNLIISLLSQLCNKSMSSRILTTQAAHSPARIKTTPKILLCNKLVMNSNFYT